MPSLPTILVLGLVTQAAAPRGANPLYRELVEDGLTIEGTRISLPRPTMADGLTPEASTAAIRGVAGDDRAARELLRDSVTAPFILKTRDVKAGRAIIRVADLWFVVHAKLDEVDLERAAREADRKVIEAGNMRFETRLLAGPELLERKVTPLAKEDGRTEWFTRVTGRLLDRIGVEATDRVVATRTPESLLVAARTDPAFEAEGPSPNRWMTLARKGSEEIKGPPQPYSGGISYVKVSRLAADPGALFVEAHFAFVEPMEWFQGNPILRSKIGLIAQDQVRQLRRDIQKARSRD